jgi:hypothetical protein
MHGGRHVIGTPALTWMSAGKDLPITPSCMGLMIKTRIQTFTFEVPALNIACAKWLAA